MRNQSDEFFTNLKATVKKSGSKTIKSVESLKTINMRTPLHKGKEGKSQYQTLNKGKYHYDYLDWIESSSEFMRVKGRYSMPKINNWIEEYSNQKLSGFQKCKSENKKNIKPVQFIEKSEREQFYDETKREYNKQMKFMYEMRLRNKILKRGGLYPGDLPTSKNTELEGVSMISFFTVNLSAFLLFCSQR